MSESKPNAFTAKPTLDPKWLKSLNDTARGRQQGLRNHSSNSGFNGRVFAEYIVPHPKENALVKT